MGEIARETFNSRLSGFLVIIMTALGLGNIWRFPYLCAQYGGAAFVIAYLIALIFIVSVGNQCEILMGKFSRRSVVGAFTSIGRRTIWRVVGWTIFCLNVLVLCYYNIVISYVTRYFFTSFSGAVWKAESPDAFWTSYIDSPQVIFWAVLVNLVVFAILWFGVNKGVERAATIIGPVLFVVMAIMVIRTLMLPGVGAGLEYYLVPHWEFLTQFETWMQAIGQGLWSGAFGWGIITTMGSYTRKHDDVGSFITQTTLLDGGISWFVGLAIIPACVVFDVSLASGNKLAFLILPEMFQAMPGGFMFMLLFFGALMISGLGAAIGCVEAAVAPLIEEWGYTRKQIILTMFVLWNLAALPSMLSKNVLDYIDYSIGTFAILLGGFFFLIFVGYCWGAERVRKNVLNVGADIPFGPWWSVNIKYIAPALLIFAGYAFIKEWLFPYFPDNVAWPTLIIIVVFNAVVLYESLRHPVPANLSDLAGASGGTEIGNKTSM